MGRTDREAVDISWLQSRAQPRMLPCLGKRMRSQPRRNKRSCERVLKSLQEKWGLVSKRGICCKPPQTQTKHSTGPIVVLHRYSPPWRFSRSHNPNVAGASSQWPHRSLTTQLVRSRCCLITRIYAAADWKKI